MYINIMIVNDEGKQNGYYYYTYGTLLCEAYYKVEDRTSAGFDFIDKIMRAYPDIRSKKMSKIRKAYKLLEATGAGASEFEVNGYINLNKDGSRYIKPTDFENVFMDENKGIITLTEETRRVMRYTSAQGIVIRYNDMTIMYDDMFKVVDKAVYNYAYKPDYRYNYEDLINIGYCPEFPVMAIPFGKWDEFKQGVLANKIIIPAKDYYGNNCSKYTYMRIN